MKDDLRGAKHSKDSISILKKWLVDNIHHPYLKRKDKAELAQASGLTPM
jgi:hypothetical protein